MRLYFMAMNKMSFTYRETGMLTLGEWMDYNEVFKEQYNFEKKQGLYSIQNADTVENLDAL